MNIKLLARDIREALIEGVAWIPVYKIGNRWVYQIMYANGGDFEEGFTFAEEDMDLLKAIAHIDHKAICLNGEYHDIKINCTCKDIEEHILYAYNMRLHQLRGDFLGRFVRED